MVVKKKNNNNGFYAKGFWVVIALAITLIGTVWAFTAKQVNKNTESIITLKEFVAKQELTNQYVKEKLDQIYNEVKK